MLGESSADQLEEGVTPDLSIEALFQQHQQSVFAVILRRVKSYHDAKDLTQDVFLRAQRNIGQLKDPNKVERWLKRIAQRVADNFNIRRKRKSYFIARGESDGDAFDVQDWKGMSAQARALQSEDSREVRATIARLRSIDQKVLNLFYFKEMPLEDIGKSLGIPLGTVKSRLDKARRRFLKKYVDYFSRD